MQYRRVGNSGLKVSAVSIGGWLTFGGMINGQTTEEVVKASIDAGINFVDLADVYARGKAEVAAGGILRDYKRSDLVISSKLFWPMSDNVNDRGLSRKHIYESVDKTLQRLGTDYIDIYFCHRHDPETPMEETVQAMDSLVRQGKVLYWGTSVWEAEHLSEAHAIADKRNLVAPTVEQPRYNLIDRHIEEAILPTCQRLGIGLVVWSPLAQGILTGKYNDGVPADSRAARTNWLDDQLTESNLERTRRFTDLCREAGEAPEQVALAWLLTRPEVSSVITGATSAEQVGQNVRAVGLELPTDLVQKIEAIFD